MYARIICTNNGTHVTLILVMSGSEISLISLPISDMLHEKEQERNNKYTIFLIHLNSYARETMCTNNCELFEIIYNAL